MSIFYIRHYDMIQRFNILQVSVINKNNNNLMRNFMLLVDY